jgi:hypothetical protein
MSACRDLLERAARLRIALPSLDDPLAQRVLKIVVEALEETATEGESPTSSRTRPGGTTGQKDGPASVDSRTQRYYFNIYNSDGRADDPEGVDLPNVEAARKQAINGVRSFLGNDVTNNGRIDLRGRIEVTEATGKIVLVVTFDEALKIVAADG